MTPTSAFAWLVAWLHGHPAFVLAVFWPVVTAIVNTAWKDASAYALTHPRFAAAKKLVQKWGLSPRGTIFLLARILGLAPPPVPPSNAGLDDAAKDAPPTPTDPGDESKDADPKDADPRNLFRYRSFRFALAASLVFSLSVSPLLTACGATTSAQKIEIGAYESEQLLCVDQAATLAESRACRAAVKSKYGRLWSDAGTEAGDASK